MLLLYNYENERGGTPGIIIRTCRVTLAVVYGKGSQRREWMSDPDELLLNGTKDLASDGKVSAGGSEGHLGGAFCECDCARLGGSSAAWQIVSSTLRQGDDGPAG
jgi:hypothetical protein